MPDVLNYSWRDYGVRVGIWRLIDVMEKHGFKGTVALNSDVCRHYPRIIEAGNTLGWEWMGHGISNSELLNEQSEKEERELIREVMRTIAARHRPASARMAEPRVERDFHTLDCWPRPASNTSATGSTTSSHIQCG